MKKTLAPIALSGLSLLALAQQNTAGLLTHRSLQLIFMTASSPGKA